MKFIFIKTPRRLGIFALVLAFFVVFTLPAQAVNSVGPALWKVENGESTLYLLGSFHMLKAGVNWRLPYIDAAFNEATSLVLEVSEADIKPEALRLLILEQGFYTYPENLDMYVDDEVVEHMLLLMQDMNIPLYSLSQFKPWYASTIIAVHHAIKNGFLPENGVEAVLTKLANERGTVIYGLESAYEQISALSSHSDELQASMLEQVIEDIENIPALYDSLMAAWMAGDEDEMTILMIDELKKFPEVFDKIYTERNQNWIPRLEEYLNQPGVHFVTVGAAHLVGEGSVIELLEGEGYVAVRQ